MVEGGHLKGPGSCPFQQPAGPQDTRSDDWIASMEPQMLHADNGAASDAQNTEQDPGSCQFLREDIGSSAGSWAGPFEPLCLNSDVRVDDGQEGRCS